MMDQAQNLRQMLKEQDTISVNNNYTSSKVISVSSGKGGVGKSNFVANLAYSFSRLGKKVVIIDADLGLANIEVLFGVIPTKNLSHVLYEDLAITDALSDGPNGIKFLSGGSGLRELSKINNREMQRVIDCFNYLDKVFDIILIDTGAGVSDIVINFIKASTMSIIIATPEPTSITDAYALIKIIKEDYAVEQRDVKMHLVINKVDDKQEGDEVYNKLKTVSEKFLQVDLTLLGYLFTDNCLISSVKKQNPAAILFPDSEYVKSINSIAYKILEIKEEVVQEEESASFAKKLFKFFGRD